MKNWNNREIEVARSEGGVLAVLNPFDNLISTGTAPWPPAEVLQKLYLSQHVKAFTGADLEKAKRSLGYYCDLQSIHSEDAITWSVFGTVARSEHPIRNKWVSTGTESNQNLGHLLVEKDSAPRHLSTRRAGG
ncbi:MAG: hypothetical protein WCO26_10685 [Deltaproteobacteria bacterium]